MQFLGELAALGAAGLWSMSSIVFTSAAMRMGTIQLNISRMILACVFLFFTLLFLNIPFALNFQQIFYLSVSGFIGLVIGDTFLFKAFEKIGPRFSMLIMASNPAIAAILAYFILGEILSVWGILGIAITLGGISLVILEEQKGDNYKFRINRTGVICAFIAAGGQGVGLVFAKFAFNYGDINGLTATFVRILAAVVIMLPGAIIIKKFNNPIKQFSEDLKGLGLVVLGSIIGPYLGITFSFIAIIYTQVGIASTLMSTAPILMLPLVIFIYKEKLSWKAILGAIVAVCGVAILFLK